MSRPLVWIVDDDPGVQEVFQRALVAAGYAVQVCGDGAQAIARLSRETPALVVLDVEMPRLDGWATLAQLRQRGCAAPVLMVTHVDDVDSRVRGLEAGADDYIGKPCRLEELTARVRALLRRAPRPKETETLELGEIKVDFAGRTARRGNERVTLSRTDFALLKLLARHRGETVTREEILAQVWRDQAGSSHALDTHVWRLRRKLGDDENSGWIVTVTGVGYALRASE